MTSSSLIQRLIFSKNREKARLRVLTANQRRSGRLWEPSNQWERAFSPFWRPDEEVRLRVGGEKRKFERVAVKERN